VGKKEKGEASPLCGPSLCVLEFAVILFRLAWSRFGFFSGWVAPTLVVLLVSVLDEIRWGRL
jgi:hypothetical protein